MIVIDAYDVSLRASKKKQDQLQTTLETVQREAAISKLEREEIEKKMVRYEREYEQQQKVLMEVQEKGKNHKIILPTQ